MWKMCICIGMRYLGTIHIIDAYSSTKKAKASPSMWVYIHICIYIIWLQWHSKHICTLGVLIQHMAIAYATSMSIKTYCILVARLLYTIISETISSLSTNIIYMFFLAPDQTIESKTITCSKNGTTRTLSRLSMLCVAISHCVLLHLNIKSMFLPFLFFLAAAHAMSRSFSSYVMPLCYLPLAYYIIFAKFCQYQYAIVFSNFKRILYVILFFQNPFLPFVLRSYT